MSGRIRLVGGLATLALVGSVVVWLASARAQDPEPSDLKTNDVHAFMRLKLGHAHKVLEGIATEDFKLIAKNAQEMTLLSEASNWQVLQTPEYEHHSRTFQRVSDTLVREAKQQDIDGAALAYVELTMSCVNCHKYTRGVRMAAVDRDAATVAGGR
jgi:cytochrome c556